MSELAKLEVDQNKAAKQPVIEDEVYVEVVTIQRKPLLSRDKAEALAKLEKEAFELINDGLLEISLLPGRLLGEAKKLEHEGILDDIGRNRDLLSLTCKREYL